MNKKLIIKLIIFFFVISSHILPMRFVVTKAQARQCCDMNCGRNVTNKMACPVQKKVQSCQNSSMQCCEDNCLKPSKSEISIHKGSSSQRFSQEPLKQIAFSYLIVSLDSQPSFLPQPFDTSQNTVQNHPLFLVNSVYLI